MTVLMQKSRVFRRRKNCLRIEQQFQIFLPPNPTTFVAILIRIIGCTEVQQPHYTMNLQLHAEWY